MKKYIVLLIAFVLSLPAIVMASCRDMQDPLPVPETTEMNAHTTAVPSPDHTVASTTAELVTVDSTETVNDPVTIVPETTIQETTVPETTIPETTIPDWMAPDGIKATQFRYMIENNLGDTEWFLWPKTISMHSLEVGMSEEQHEILVEYRTKLFDEWKNEDIHPYEYLPIIYYEIQALKPTREEFDRLHHESQLASAFWACPDGYPPIPEHMIEALLNGDADLVRRVCHANSAYYYDGELYHIFDLMRLDNDALLKEMCQKGDLLEFVERFQEYISDYKDTYYPNWGDENLSENPEFLDFLDRIASLT